MGERIRMRIPERFKRARLGDLDRESFLMVHDFASAMPEWWSRGLGLSLTGPPGIGKTYAIAALTRYYVEHADQCHGKGRPGDYEFVTVYDLIDRLPVLSGDGEWDEYRDQPFMTTYSMVPWLVMNDMGKEYRGGKLSEQATYKFGRLLRSRSERKLVTHVTTNLDPKQLKDTYGESITSLLAEMVKTFTVHGPDRRRRRATGR